MKFKIVLLVLVVGAVVLLNSFTDVIVHPTIAADVAVGQLENDEGAAITMRGYDTLYNAFPLISWGAATLFGLFMFRSNIKGLFASDRRTATLNDL